MLSKWPSQLFFKCLDTCMPTYDRSTFITEESSLVIYVQLFQMTAKVEVMGYTALELTLIRLVSMMRMNVKAARIN